MWRRTPSQFLLVLIAGSLLIAGAWDGEPRAEETTCVSPPYILAPAEVHYHPTVVIVLYRRNADPSNPIHDVVALVTPDEGLGIDANQEVAGQVVARTRYRAIHAHDNFGELHVEHEQTHSRRMCELVQLWREQPRHRGTIDALVGSRLAHIRIGDHYRKNVPIDEVLRIPLDHNMPIFVFIEKRTRL